MTGEIYRTEHEEPETARWTRLEIEVRDKIVRQGVAETSNLPMLAEAVRAVLEACSGKSVAQVLDLSLGETRRALGDVAFSEGDVGFALCAVQNALRGRTH